MLHPPRIWPLQPKLEACAPSTCSTPQVSIPTPSMRRARRPSSMPLPVATRARRTDCLPWVLLPDVSDAKGTPALVLATQSNRVDIVRLLLSAHGKGGLDKHGAAALVTAVKLRSVPGVTLLLQHGVNAGSVSETLRRGLKTDAPQVAALLEGRVADVQRAQDDFVRSSKTGSMPAISRVIRNMGVEFSLDADQVAPHAPDAHVLALHWLLNQGRDVTTLIQHPADFLVATADGETLLHRAALLGSKAIIEAALRAGADFGISTRRHGSLLHAAVRGAATGELIALIARQVTNIDAVDQHGLTALHEAARMGRSDAVKTLLDLGAKASTVSEKGETPLSMAARAGNHAGVQALLASGAPVQQRVGADSDTVLHEAVRGWRLCHRDGAHRSRRRHAPCQRRMSVAHPPGGGQRP